MSYVFVADDFTGASDTLATLARGGLRTRLFLDVPPPDAVRDLDAWGVATDARSLDQDGMKALARRIGTALLPHRPEFLHVKICSTFDSSETIGNVALLVRGLSDATGVPDIAVVAGQPSLGRYAIFGTLFAKASDGRIHRIDRHPVMSSHPVTPMAEADIRLHLAQLGLPDLEQVSRCGKGHAFPRLYDLLDQADVTAVGRDLDASGRRLVIMGSSSVAEAWLAVQAGRRPCPPIPPTADGPVLALAGSRSSLTNSQIAAASALPSLPLDPARLLSDEAAFERAIGWSAERLRRGEDCLLYLTEEGSINAAPAELARRSAELIEEIAKRGVGIGGLIVAGGDTSSAILRQLAPQWLDYAGDVCAGVPILHARLEAGNLPVIMKGGQMGPDHFFQIAIAMLHGN
nr:four-carbon acid sugar kinase family protein [Paracoccus saliphilus]